MVNCKSCSAEQNELDRFCSECGAALASDNASTAMHVNQDLPGATSDRSRASDSSHHGRFLPGTTIANRYRIVSLVGKGGMGEVYRADDLKLGHTVALKFLPKNYSDDPGRMELMHAEVRLTRQISHPNVCRVYDISEVEGQHFLSMEYIDGEDLRILLRRIGRIPADKGVQIAQQLCAGLAAAHERGVLHRDLKPANLMIDGQGQVRITDFGLARLADDNATGDVSGTPAYMAPEQLLAGQTSKQSDLYALGLVLAEVFTGKSINQTNDIADLMARHQSSESSVTSLNSKDLDPVVEQAILSCLARDPEDRPRSARQLANALPGGDPLEAATAAGVTPSPELVANATDKNRLRFPVAVAMLIVTVAWLLVFTYLNRRSTRMLETAPAVLSAKCEQILQTLGYNDLPANNTCGIGGNAEIYRILQESAKDQAWLDQHPQPKFQFWRRWTDGSFMVKEFHAPYIPDFETPTIGSKRELDVMVDEQGRLIELKVVAPVEGTTSTANSNFDWSTLLELAGIGQELVTVTPLVSNPPVHCDHRIAWVVSDGGEGQRKLQAGASDGRVNYFEVVGLSESMNLTSMEQQQPLFLQALTVFVMLFVFLFAWLNIRASRADCKNALRAGAFVLLLYFVQEGAALNLNAPDFASSILGLFGDRAWGHILGHGFFVTAAYIAIEPYIRRYWPRSMVGMARLLGGRWRDPIVGKELLAGVTLAGVFSIFPFFLQLSEHAMSGQTNVFLFLGSEVTVNTPVWIARMAQSFSSALLQAFLAASICLIVRLSFRKIRFEYSMVAFALLLAIAYAIWRPSTAPWYAELLLIFSICTFAFVLTRYGLLTLYVAGCTLMVMNFTPPLQLNSWYAGYAVASLLILFGIALMGFVTSQGGLAKLIQFVEADESMA
jgi:tRNA A-37 threonylcarbamoyl transferase component Bud32